MITVELAYHAANLLGETPLWDYRDQHLVWVDIDGRQILRFEPRTGNAQEYQQTEMVTALGLRAQGGYVAATRLGIAFYDLQNNFLEPVVSLIEENAGGRFNDAAVDPFGRFWAGVYNKERRPTSGLYYLDQGLRVKQVESNLIASNGIGWSPDRRHMYHTDTTRRTIYQYDFDLRSGAVSNRSPFVITPDVPNEGRPDGLAVDAQGNIWSARYGGGKVVCYNPDGKLEEEVLLPAKNVTSCAFGSGDLDQLFITTARIDKSRPPADAYEGSLFVANPGVRGQPVYQFAG